MKTNIRKSYGKAPAQNYNDVSLVEEHSDTSNSSSSSASDKPNVVNDVPIIISDTSNSGGSTKENCEIAVPPEDSQKCSYVPDSSKQDKENFIKKWIEEVAVETTFEERSVFTEMSTIQGIDNDFVPKEKGKAVNSTFANGTEKRFDEFFKNKQVDNFESSVKNMGESFMEALVVNDSFETKNSGKSDKSKLTNSSNAKRVIDDSFECKENKLENVINSSMMTNDDSDLSYKILPNSDNARISSKSILSNDKINKIIKAKVSDNSILTNDESDSSSKPTSNYDPNRQSGKTNKTSVTPFNKENTPHDKNSPCTPRTNFYNIPKKLQKQRKQSWKENVSSSASSVDESDTDNENNLKDAESVLDAVYGNSWREKQALILPKSEPRKNNVRPENLSRSERRNRKHSYIYNNPYLNGDLSHPKTTQIQNNVKPSPLLEKLKKLCDSDTTSDEDQKHLHKQKLNFDEVRDGRTSKYFQKKSERTPEQSPDEFGISDLGKSLEERIKKKMNNICVETLKVKSVNCRKNNVHSKTKPMKAVHGTEINIEEAEENSATKGLNSDQKKMSEVGKSITKSKRFQSVETSRSTSDRRRNAGKAKQYCEPSGGDLGSDERSLKNNKKTHRSKSISSLESDTKSSPGDKKQKGETKKSKNAKGRFSTSSSESDRVKDNIFKTPTVSSGRPRRKKNDIVFLDDNSESEDSDDEFDEKVRRIHRSSLAHGKYSFLESLTGSVPIYSSDFKARMYRNNYKNLKNDLAAELFKLYNDKIFENKIPEDTPLQWNDRMRGTAGYCYCRKITRSNGNIERLVRIELATKVLDSPDRLRDTLVHEMCHAATWIINCVSDGHGSYWKSWAYKAMSTFPELPPIKRCHDYVLNTKYTYKCSGCGYSFGRHTKSLDTERKRCGHCFGKFEVLINKISKKGESKSVPVTPKREATGFALFVKQNYSGYKTPDRKHGDVMRILGQKFQEMKVKK
ncbi:unnamed protein product [Acanthoscelides obtectus]|nr:unnamed protein product [Acanthoscelides obtectus]CAK1637381.1 Acidic repeat-containing protein [Acanthoscelides obtectus]